jgi:hypothetical protein
VRLTANRFAVGRKQGHLGNPAVAKRGCHHHVPRLVNGNAPVDCRVRFIEPKAPDDIHELIEGCAIRDAFRQIYASKFIYTDGVAAWPGVVISYTTKTQYLFRINKGIDNHWDNTAINDYVPESERPISFERMSVCFSISLRLPRRTAFRRLSALMHILALFCARQAQRRQTAGMRYWPRG